MICAKNYENIFKFVKATHRILQTLFQDTLYAYCYAVKKTYDATKRCTLRQRLCDHFPLTHDLN